MKLRPLFSPELYRFTRNFSHHPPRMDCQTVANFCFVHCMTQTRQITVPDSPHWRKRLACALCYQHSTPDSRINAQSLRCCVLLFPKTSLGIFWLLRQSPDCVRVQTQRRFSSLTYPGLLYRPLLSELDLPSSAAFTANSLIWFGYTWVLPKGPGGRLNKHCRYLDGENPGRDGRF